MRTYHVYIMTNVHRTAMYIGVTNDLERRVAEHRAGAGGAFTRRYRIDTLVHVETCDRIDDAIAREKELKGWRREKKDRLVESANPAWADLAPRPPLDPSLRSG
ncbi:MAG: GIY-YIG nuclease family protein [Rhodospirillales bacterium]|nr:MAG: GIY-YIG nuclease family protein [Rhodospirillales bacterium]